jgi:hypothetical protein
MVSGLSELMYSPGYSQAIQDDFVIENDEFRSRSDTSKNLSETRESTGSSIFRKFLNRQVHISKSEQEGYVNIEEF